MPEARRERGRGQQAKDDERQTPKPKAKTKKPKALKKPAALRLDATITAVVDGDTVKAKLRGGATKTVRMIGIDTPEKTGLRNGAPECGGQPATDALEAFRAAHAAVTLVTDPTQDRYDRYGRLLAYIEPDTYDLGSEQTYQQFMLTAGWGDVYVYDKPFKRLGRFSAAAIAGYRARAGAWAICGGNFHRPLGQEVGRAATPEEAQAIVATFAYGGEAACNYVVIMPSGLWTAVWPLREEGCNGGDGVGFAYRPDPAAPWQSSDLAGSDLRCEDFWEPGDSTTPSRADVEAVGACWP